MRILHVVHRYPPEYTGGTELYTQTLAATQARENHWVAVFHRSVTAQRSEHRVEGEVDVWSAGGPTRDPVRRFLATYLDSGVVRSFEHCLDTVQPDLVHIQHLMGLPLEVMASVRRRAIPYLVTLHDYWWICANAQLLTNDGGRICPGPDRYLNCAHCALARIKAPALSPGIPALASFLGHRARSLRDVLNASAVLIAPTQFVKGWYAEHGVPRDRIEVVPHGIDPPIPVVKALRSDRPVRFAAIGGVAWQKGIHVLLEAFQGIRGPAELWIAGDETADPAYARDLRALASPRVRFLGRLSHPEVWRTLGQIDFLAVPSLWYETYSLIAHEAFAAGVPVMASHTGALAEAVRDGVDGLLVPPGDVDAWRCAMQSVMDEPGRLDCLRTNIHSPLTVAEHVARIDGVYGRAM